MVYSGRKHLDIDGLTKTAHFNMANFRSNQGARGVIMNGNILWAASSEFVSSSIPSWQILTAHAQPFRGARDLPFCLKVPLDSLLVWASSGGSGETARMRRLAWTLAVRIGDKYQIRLTRPLYIPFSRSGTDGQSHRQPDSLRQWSNGQFYTKDRPDFKIHWHVL